MKDHTVISPNQTWALLLSKDGERGERRDSSGDCMGDGVSKGTSQEHLFRVAPQLVAFLPQLDVQGEGSGQKIFLLPSCGSGTVLPSQL